MRQLSKALLIVYLLALSWLVLFKFSYDLPTVLTHHMRSLNLNPCAVFTQGSLREALDNVIVFIPFGLLLSINFKQVGLRRKLVVILLFSLTAEILQYILAIGTTDIADVITNTAGGLLGLASYTLISKYVHDKTHDRFIVVVISIILMLVLSLRFFVLRVRY